MLLQKGDERLRLIVDSRRSFLVLHALLASERIGHLDPPVHRAGLAAGEGGCSVGSGHRGNDVSGLVANVLLHADRVGNGYQLAAAIVAEGCLAPEGIHHARNLVDVSGDLAIKCRHPPDRQPGSARRPLARRIGAYQGIIDRAAGAPSGLETPSEGANATSDG